MIILAENYWLLSRAVTGRDTLRKQTLVPGLSQVPRTGPHSSYVGSLSYWPSFRECTSPGELSRAGLKTAHCPFPVNTAAWTVIPFSAALICFSAESAGTPSSQVWILVSPPAFQALTPLKLVFVEPYSYQGHAST